MNLLKFIDRFSFKQLLSASVFLAILLSIPIGVWLVNQQTQLSSRAAIESPTTSPTPTPTFGPQPTMPPVIKEVKPFLGKVGDTVIIAGENLGNNPAKRKVWFGNQATNAKDILSWKDKEVQIQVPAGASSGAIRLEVEPWQVTWPKIFTVYDRSAKTQVLYLSSSIPGEMGLLGIKNVRGLKKAQIWNVSGEVQEVTFETPKTVDEEGLNLLSTGKIAWVTLFDQNNRPIPFFVNPAEFGF